MKGALHLHPVHSRHPHLLRLILIGLLALLAYLAWTETASAEERTLVVLSSDFEMQHYTVGGAIESKPRESETACEKLKEGVSAAATSHPDLDVVPLPELAGDEQAAVEEHVALLSTQSSKTSASWPAPLASSWTQTSGRSPSHCIGTRWAMASRS
jgi:hypothetical protein